LVDAKAQTEQKLKELRTTQSTNQADFFSLFIAPASAIKESRGSKLRGISYRDGQLDIQLSTREIQAIEALKKRLEN
ncbi:general secretion pathway protein GspL, partial [Candidatus Endoriftia persephone str. Guaymas]|nr:general secretion pathway protein GspL [Candidatus Endoriftia persephone str. Guaymas]